MNMYFLYFERKSIIKGMQSQQKNILMLNLSLVKRKSIIKGMQSQPKMS